MSSTPDHRSPPEEQAGTAATDPSFKLLERRRLLLKGLGKGTAAAATLVPLQSLATTKLLTGNNMGCSISGMQSAVRSQTGGATYCKGYKPSCYSNKNKWPGYGSHPSYPLEGYFVVSSKIVSTLPTCKFNSIFAGGSNTNSVYDIARGAAGSVDERAWLLALLNSKWHSLGKPLNFPYSPGTVLTFYGSTNHANAQKLFKDHLQTEDGPI